MTSKNEVLITGDLESVNVEDTKNGKKMARLVIQTDPPAWMKNVTAKDRTQVIVFGNTVRDVEGFRPGQCVSLMGRARGREYNGKWYCDIIGEKFKVIGNGAAKAPPPSEDSADEMP